MNYIKTSLWALAAMTLVACSNDDDQQSTITPVSKSFSASIGDITRTTLSNDADNPYPIWSANDGLKVYNATTQSSADFTISSGVGSRAADFEGTISVDNEAQNKFYAFYCGNATGENAPQLVTTGETPQISATIPAEQPTTAGFHPELHFMTACTTGNAFKFKNAMSLLKVTISENNYENFGICRIRFKANNPDENIAGTFTATIADDGTLGDYTVTNGSNEIVIGDGTTALATGSYYIAILPCAFSQGFTLAFEDAKNNNLKVYDRIKETSFNVGKSEIINLDSYTAKECAKQAYVDLGITNSNGQKILWGIENIYDEAGKTIAGTSNKTVETDPTSSFYAWGETYVKSNQNKVSECQNYSWYYTYSFMEGTEGGSNEDATSLTMRSYKYGVGGTAITSGSAATLRWNFTVTESNSNPGLIDDSGVLKKYNSLGGYTSNVSDWYGGTRDNLTVLETVDDVAYQNSNGKMRIPSEDDFLALANASSNTDPSTPLVCGPSANSGGKLYKFKNRTTGHYIELSLNGYMRTTKAGDADPHKQPTWGCYWTRNRTSTASDSYMARAAKIVNSTGSDGGISIVDANRCAGRMIRGVIYR